MRRGRRRAGEGETEEEVGDKKIKGKLRLHLHQRVMLTSLTEDGNKTKKRNKIMENEWIKKMEIK